jgi:ribosomal protein L37AE/L43A
MKIRGISKGKDLVEVVDEVIASVEECPECTGTNLNEEKTLCWDCSAKDWE